MRNTSLLRPIARKQSYHPYILLGFYLSILPAEVLERIPASTRHDWKQRKVALLFGYDWYLQNQSSFTVMQEVFTNRKLQQLNKALLRIIAVKRFMDRYQVRIRDRVGTAHNVVLDNMDKVAGVIPVTRMLKYLQLSYGSYLKMRRNSRCDQSLLHLCRVKHPLQLLNHEVAAIKQYCIDHRWLHWPLSSVYHQMVRDRAVVCTMATFYKYVRLMKLQRAKASHRRKHHHLGIRAGKPLEILHADATIVRTIDNVKSYIYFVQDNYSRAILAHQAALDCKASYVFRNLQMVKEYHLQPGNVKACRLITDDGCENKGIVKALDDGQQPSTIEHLIAQSDIEYSNSMIEALNKQIKYRFLYHRQIADHEALRRYLHQAVDDYNNRPQAVLHGLTPAEVLNGQQYKHCQYRQQITAAKAARMAVNKKAACCHTF